MKKKKTLLHLATAVALETMWDFLCAKALQQTHILPAKLMPPLPVLHPNPQNKNESFPGEEMASEKDTAVRMIKPISVLGSTLFQM